MQATSCGNSSPLKTIDTFDSKQNSLVDLPRLLLALSKS
jgi:hypothetical protein